MKDSIENVSNHEKPRKFFVEGRSMTVPVAWGVRSERSTFEEAKKDLYEILDEPRSSSRTHGEDFRIVDEEGKVYWPKEEKS